MKPTLLTVRLRFTTPGGVTAPEAQRFEDITTDTGETRTRNTRPLRRDPAGNVHLPGTSLAGSLREHCAADPVLADSFGPEPGADRGASAVQVLGTVLRTVPAPTLRGRTAIDRARAAARTHTLHAVEMLPAETEFDLFLRWDDATPAELTALRTALESWAPIVGVGASVGAGRTEVIGLGDHTYDLRTEDGLSGWLALAGPEDYPRPHPIDTTAATRPRTTYTFRIVDALHIGSGATTTGTHHQQVADIVRSGDAVVIPGTSLKGVLRSRVEYICRVLGLPACGTAICGECRPCRLFGHGSDDPDRTPARALVAILDAPVRNPITEHRQHVAIDRFTGGAHDQLLFTHNTLTAGEFDLVIETLTDEAPTESDRALVEAAITDLHAGLIGLGARTTAGYGTVEIIDPDWEPADFARLNDLATTGAP